MSCCFISLLRMPFACSSSQRRARSYHQHSHDDQLAVPPATRSKGVIDRDLWCHVKGHHGLFIRPEIHTSNQRILALWALCLRRQRLGYSALSECDSVEAHGRQLFRNVMTPALSRSQHSQGPSILNSALSCVRLSLFIARRHRLCAPR